MCGMFNLDVWDNNAEYLVLDDIPFEYVGGGRKALWGGQKELTLTDKFRRKVSVTWNKPTIFLCNPGEDFRTATNSQGRPLLNYNELQWYENNSCIVKVDRPLFG